MAIASWPILSQGNASNQNGGACHGFGAQVAENVVDDLERRRVDKNHRRQTAQLIQTKRMEKSQEKRAVITISFLFVTKTFHFIVQLISINSIWQFLCISGSTIQSSVYRIISFATIIRLQKPISPKQIPD